MLTTIFINCLSVIFIEKEKTAECFLGGSILLFYVALLYYIKKTYPSLNIYFIKRNWIDKIHANKDYTCVEVSEYPGDDIWDKKLASKPSLLDYILTIVVMGLLPLPLATGLYELIVLINKFYFSSFVLNCN